MAALAHLGVGLAAKRIAPEIPVGYLLPARLRERIDGTSATPDVSAGCRSATTGTLFRRSTHVSLVFRPLLWNIRSVTGRFPLFLRSRTPPVGGVRPRARQNPPARRSPRRPQRPSGLPEVGLPPAPSSIPDRPGPSSLTRTTNGANWYARR